MTTSDDRLKQLLNFDSYAEAEQMTKQQWEATGQWIDTPALGLALHMGNGKAKRAELQARKDSHMSSSVADYLSIVQDLGFTQINAIPFTNRYGDNNTQYFFWHMEYSILLEFDTYSGNINGSKFTYNHRPANQQDLPWECYSSGGWRETPDGWVKVGNHDGREAIRYHIEQLLQHGDFVTNWIEYDFIWPYHHGDTDETGEVVYGNGYKDYTEENAIAIFKERILHNEDIINKMGLNK